MLRCTGAVHPAPAHPIRTSPNGPCEYQLDMPGPHRPDGGVAAAPLMAERNEMVSTWWAAERWIWPAKSGMQVWSHNGPHAMTFASIEPYT